MEEQLNTLEEYTDEAPLIHKEKGDLAYWASLSLIMGDVRVAAQVRLAHLAKTGRKSPDTANFLKVAQTAEEFVDGRLATHILPHPTWPWASKVKGLGKENYPKAIGLINAFGRFYDVGDPLIPPFVTRSPQPYLLLRQGEVVEKTGIWVEGIERLAVPSKLWKYAGLAVENGQAARREAGKKISFNWELRMTLYRVAISLNRAGGIWYRGGDRDQGYSRGYLGHRAVIENMLLVKGFKIVPTPKERMCLACNKPVALKRAKYCPDCGGSLTLKTEPPGVIFQGHVHQRAIRLLMKDFSLCVWKVWREALGLPCPAPYDEAMLAHPKLDPYVMVDRETNAQGGSK